MHKRLVTIDPNGASEFASSHTQRRVDVLPLRNFYNVRDSRICWLISYGNTRCLHGILQISPQRRININLLVLQKTMCFQFSLGSFIHVFDEFVFSLLRHPRKVPPVVRTFRFERAQQNSKQRARWLQINEQVDW